MTKQHSAHTTVAASTPKQTIIAVLALTGIGLHLLLRLGLEATDKVFGLPLLQLPLLAILLVSGDRESEVPYLADQVGIRDVFYSQSAEEKLELVRKETEQANTVFLGDGINDAPALSL